ncbi:MAG: DUF6049 family protein [Streptosporangiaceae bacterium]
MHGLLPANFIRRTLSRAAAVAVAAAAVVAALLALGTTPAQARPVHPSLASGVSVTIDSMSPRYATPGSTVSITGMVSNGSGQPKTGLQVQLYTSPTPFTARDQMDEYLSQGDAGGLVAAGTPFTLTVSLAPGTTVQWHASFRVASAGISTFGVYPVTAQVSDSVGNMLASDQTLLPFWSGRQAAGLQRPLAIAWVWPLIDQPHHAVCAAPAANDVLTNNGLAVSLAPTGRLSALLAAGQANADAKLTWVIDPALLGDVQTMTHPYQVDLSPQCVGDSTQPASRAATAWLSALRTVTSYQATVLTPYADVDVSALVHSGLNADLTSAYTTGYAVADQVLRRSFTPSIAVPAGGTADVSVLTTLATAEHITTVVLDSSEMPSLDTAGYVPDDAVTKIRTPAGTSLNILLADPILTSVLSAGDTSSGLVAPGTQFAVSQRFLAETAMIAAEAPSSSRSIVVAPPSDWSPSATLADGLLSETEHAPWLAPTALGSLAQTPDTYASVARQPPPSNRASPGELSRSYLSTVSAVDARLGVYKSMLDHPALSYLQSLDEERAAAESSAWRGGAGQGGALADSLSAYLGGEDGKVQIVVSPQVSMGGASGQIPVSIRNGGNKAIEVQLYASADNSPDRPSQLTFGHARNVVTVPPGQAVTARLQVSSAPIGSTLIHLSLTSANGTPLTFADGSFTVVSTRYGRAILFLIGAAIGVLVLTSGFRAVRRGLNTGGRVTPEEADPAGTVVTGTSGARHPTEAPDDLAEARRRADDA